MSEPRSITVIDGTYAEALAKVREMPGWKTPPLRVHTRRTRIIAMPERITGKNGDRIFGAERIHPRTDGWRLRRTFAKVRRD